MSTEKESSNLTIKSLSQVVEEAKEYIEKRRTGEERSLKVSSNKVNEAIMNGFDWGRIITVAGLSGSGKSTIARQWLKEMVELNPKEKFEILSFQFEMLGVDELARDLSSKANMSVKNIYSANAPLTQEQKNYIDILLKELSKYPISIVDNIGTVVDIMKTIMYFVNSHKLIENKKGLVVSIDHTLLVKPEKHQDEKQVVDALMHMLVMLKKFLSSKGLKIMFFVLSQLNRNIEMSERITNPRLHYPNKTDIFGASSIYYSSDYVIVIHRPAIIEGLGNWYGPAKRGFPNGLPVFNPDNPEQPMIYLHIIKERFGSNEIIAMLDELERSHVAEFKRIQQ